MVFPILPANTLSTGAYDIENSCRFDDGSSPYLHRTPSSQGSLRKFTFSAWIKKTENTGGTTFQWLLHSGEADGDPAFGIGFRGDAFAMLDMSSSTYHIQLYSNALFRDPSAWYHMVVAVDTEQGTAANRVKVYMNNEQITSWATGTLPDEDHDLDGGLNKTSDATEIGRDNYGGGAAYIDGYLSEVYFIDGTQYAPSDFGEADEDSGIWKPKDAKDDLTFGTNGFYLEFKASAVGSGSASTIGADTSGETNHLTSSGIAVTDQCTDTPTNNFCTINPLHFGSAVGTVAMSEGNAIFSSSGSDTWRSSTMAISKGKWYAEFKITGTATAGGVGINNGIQTAYIGSNSYDYIFGFSGVVYNNDADAGGSFAAPATNDINGVAVDLDNNKIYWSENGTFLNSGDPTSGATGTGAISVSSTNPSGFYHFAVGDAGGGTVTFECNFGNPAFTVSSGNADANGYGNFEYAVPSGYYALCSKNLAEYG